MDFERVAIINGERAAGWCKTMACEIEHALRRHGIEAERVDTDGLAPLCTAGNGASPRTILVDFNHRIVLPWQRPMVSLMVDHPCSLMTELAAPRSENAVTGWVDATHLPAVKALGFNHRCFFLPHAGPEPAAQPLPFDEREIDVFFAGSLEEPVARPMPSEQLSLDDLVFDLIAYCERSGAAVLPAAVAVLQARGLATTALPRETFAQLLTLALKHGETNRRLDLLLALPETLRIAIASDYLPKALRDRPNIRYLGYFDDFAAIRTLMRQSKVVLNATAKFPAGSHERIWYAIAEGAVVLTDRSVFMQQDFTDGESILYLPQKAIEPGDLDLVAGIAADRMKLARIAEAATSIYRERHSWVKRAPYLIEALRAA